MHKSNLNSIKNCWEVFRHLATPADILAIMVQKTGYLLHMFFIRLLNLISLKRNKTYPENSFLYVGEYCVMPQYLVNYCVQFDTKNRPRVYWIKSNFLHNYVFLASCHHQRKGSRIFTMSGNCYTLVLKFDDVGQLLHPSAQVWRCRATVTP